MIRRPPRSTRTDTLVPYTTLFRSVDRTIIEVAATNDGRYTIDAHLRHDPNASERFAETHVRRLEAMRRVVRSIEREPNGAWVIRPGPLDQGQRFEVQHLRNRPVTVQILSAQPNNQMPPVEAPP